MWESKPQLIRFSQYENDHQNLYDRITTTTINPNPNASIDLVVTQVDQLSNQINTLIADGEAAGLQIADRGVETYNRMSSAFNNGTIQNINRIGDIASNKFYNWPVTELIVVVVCGAVLVVITLIFLFVLCGERITIYRNRKKLATESNLEVI